MKAECFNERFDEQNHNNYSVSPDIYNFGAGTSISLNSTQVSASLTDRESSHKKSEMTTTIESKFRNIKKSCNNLIYDTWFTEILSVVISLGSLLAIVALLSVFDQKKLPDWPFKINLNALVSTFATILTSSLTQAVSSAIGA